MFDESTEPEPNESTDDDSDVSTETDTEIRSGEHAAEDGAPLHPLIDLSRDPTPGKPDHARPEEG